MTLNDWVTKRLPSFKIALGDDIDASNSSLKFILASSLAVYLELKYPSGNVPVNEDGFPRLDFRAESWILRAAIEFYNRVGSEGQIGHNENSLNRTYESGALSASLRREITPVVGIGSQNAGNFFLEFDDDLFLDDEDDNNANP